MGHLKVFLYPRIIKSGFYFIVNTPVTTFRSRYPAQCTTGTIYFGPGESLRKLNVSRTPTREAFNRFERDGLLPARAHVRGSRDNVLRLLQAKSDTRVFRQGVLRTT